MIYIYIYICIAAVWTLLVVMPMLKRRGYVKKKVKKCVYLSVFWNKSRSVSGWSSSILSSALLLHSSMSWHVFLHFSISSLSSFSISLAIGCDRLSGTWEESSCWGAPAPAGGSPLLSSSCNEPAEERGDKVPDPSLSSSEQVDLVVTESLDLSFTLLHQLCSDSRTLSAIKAFLCLDPIYIKKKTKTHKMNIYLYSGVIRNGVSWFYHIYIYNTWVIITFSGTVL